MYNNNAKQKSHIQEVFMEYLWLIAGFALLVVGADIFVEGSSVLAKLFKIPSIIIGLTIVAFGTSLPEASVSVSAAIAGQNDIAISNVLGSNIFNLLVVLGASALICPVKSNASAIKREIPFSILITAVLGGIIALGINVVNPDLNGLEKLTGSEFTVGLWGGIVLLVLFALYMYWQISGAVKSIKSGEIAEEEDDNGIRIPASMSVKMIILGIVGIILGGNLVVDNATIIAENFGMSQTFIGLTIVAVGTSLPELVTSIVAARKGESDLALGNVIGSNIFNIVFILGASAVISPMTIDVSALYDTVILFVISIIALIFAITKKNFSRLEGAALLAMYGAYFAYILVR